VLRGRGFCPPVLTAQSATDFGHPDRLMDATEQPLCATLTELQHTETGVHNCGYECALGRGCDDRLGVQMRERREALRPDVTLR
jgi:hypothetical protein